MESNKELMLKKGKIPKSPRTYPKRMPTYVVAYTVQETLDDPQKLQLITNKQSTENSTPSISPTESNNSAKTFIITPTEKLSTVLNIATLSEVKIDILDDNQCGDVVEKKSPQISSNVAIDNNWTIDKPEIICNAPKHIKRHKDSNRCTSKKPRKSKRVNIHFKYKKPKNCITRTLEKYYEKTKSNTPNAEQIQNQIYSNVLSQVVSRSQVLKKVLLADSDRISSLDGVTIFENDNDSMNSSPSTTKKSFISYTSQKTLVRMNSSSSRNEDFNSMKNTSSIIQLTSNKQSPYKSDIISVSLAVAFNASKTDTDQTGFSSNETLIHKENLTSSETFLQSNTTELTSKPPSSDEPNYKIDYDDLTLTSMTLKEKVQSNEAQEVKSGMAVRSDEDTFVIAKTSSDFNKSSIRSDCTLTFNSDSTTFPAENTQSSIPSNEEFTDNISNKTTLLDKVKFLGFYPTKTPSVGSSANLASDLNDVLMADSNNITNIFPITSKNITDGPPTDTQRVSVLRKPLDLKNMTYLQNNISLPNDVAIRAKLKEVEEARRSCPDSVRNEYPTDLADMWDRLTVVLDFAVKRLEDTLADKITKEIRESLAIFNQPESKIPTVAIQRVKTTVAPVSCDRPIPTMLHKEIFAMEDHFKRDMDMCVQCDLVQKQVIDQLMLKLSAEVTKPIPSVDPLKILQPPELLKDHLEVLKPPVALAKESGSTEAEKVDTVTVSTATTALSNRSNLNRFEDLLSFPFAFLRENAFVISSVPTFFIVMLFLYGIIVLIMNP